MHIPKTAGNAIQSVLRKYSEDRVVKNSHDKDGIHRFGVVSSYGTEKHATLTNYFTVLSAEKFKEKQKITCIRNPWDRAISFYFSPHRECNHWDRNEFIHTLDNIQPISYFMKLPHTTDLKANFDFIIRYEQIDLDFSNLCQFLGFSAEKLPKINQGIHQSYIKYYDSELIDLVADRFQEDITLFSYEFNK
ncbi:sulfotransferase family 2 domain-containing protein [Candidatus Nitrosacidococcus tergens]|uniref:sulfotransferase family 2 domain-containing protein n=1 Tax=Candidatus Nitrosacidococcus tergens TaxID=553981 RepID=UPI001E3CD8EF|nr:sulfotransferase family 2 domain-containing protein [Candidatus Nitrosacidococcus tergens]